MLMHEVLIAKEVVMKDSMDVCMLVHAELYLGSMGWAG
jgi:hypothetical protein